MSVANEQKKRSFKLGSVGATVARTSALETFKFLTATLNENQCQNNSQFSQPAHITNRDRSQSSKNRYGWYSRWRHVDKTTLNQINEDFGPAGVFPGNEPPVNRFARTPFQSASH